MKILLILLGLLLLFLVLILIVVMASTITVQTDLALRNKEYRAKIYINLLYGLIQKRFEFKVPIYLNKEEKEREAARLEEKMKTTKRLSPQEFRSLLQATDGFTEWMLKTAAKIKLSRIFWSTNVSLDDAAETAAAAGSLWGIKHTVLGWMSYHLNMQSPPEISVYPDFNGPPHFATSFHCTASMSAGRMMLSGVGLAVRIFKVEGGMKTWKRMIQKQIEMTKNSSSHSQG